MAGLKILYRLMQHNPDLVKMLQPKQAKRFNLDAIYSEDIVVKVCLLLLKHNDDIVLGDLV